MAAQQKKYAIATPCGLCPQTPAGDRDAPQSPAIILPKHGIKLVCNGMPLTGVPPLPGTKPRKKVAGQGNTPNNIKSGHSVSVGATVNSLIFSLDMTLFGS
ncbi:MAG: hypothetical protein H7836_13525, partial [Magnetococcus sp. YQC-3]